MKYELVSKNCAGFEKKRGEKAENSYHYKRKRKRKGNFDIQKLPRWRYASYLTV